MTQAVAVFDGKQVAEQMDTLKKELAGLCGGSGAPAPDDWKLPTGAELAARAAGGTC